MKSIVGGLLIVAVSTLLVLLPLSRHDISAVHAGSGCTRASLTGSYAFSWSGFTNPNGPQPGHQAPWAAAGTATFDGAGNVSTNYSTSNNGQVFAAQSSSGTYEVNSDCSGSLSFTSGNAAGFTANLVLANNAREILGVDTGAGDTMSFDLKRR